MRKDYYKSNYFNREDSLDREDAERTQREAPGLMWELAEKILLKKLVDQARFGEFGPDCGIVSQKHLEIVVRMAHNRIRYSKNGKGRRFNVLVPKGEVLL